ncbi:YycH family regulatory protein [Paenibacillus sp. GCM10012307]|uniref:Regulatory protein YycH domain-containing protein n=1 Tax=Paenibacillus roseus TaxID=2798579 RepID=A0A934J6I6_9BACL|nr:two-component system activity regulator YycH [Paenibacillus roseus]MBJ6361656.1 hypothetical protein [Paenibacillus roseus]
MIEKFKTGVLAFLVVLSLLQSYFLAYSFPSLGPIVTSEQDYVQTEKIGKEERVENLIFPEDIVLHLGEDKHTVLYPDTEFYKRVLEKLRGREFKGFERNMVNVQDWSAIRKGEIGLELRFGYGVPVELLQKMMKLDGDLMFLNDYIDRIWIYKVADRDEVRVYFFSSQSGVVYESIRADLTISDVQEYVGYGEYWPSYKTNDGELYLPTKPLEAIEAVIKYETYSPEQMQKNLFFDPSSTRTIEDRSGTQIYTDGKRGMQVEQDGQWIKYTDPVAASSSKDQLSSNVYSAISFINQHGGWDGLHRFINPKESGVIEFRQYYQSMPIMSLPGFRFGLMELVLQQGNVTEYERSLMTISYGKAEKQIRYLPGGEQLDRLLSSYHRRAEVEAVYPALRPSLTKEALIRLTPVWAIRLKDGTSEILSQALPASSLPPQSVQER